MAASLAFNSLLLEISDSLSAEQLERLKFLCAGDIRKRELERIATGHRLFQTLTERGRLGPDNTAHLAQLLEQIKRSDLRDRLTSYTGDRAPESGHRDSLDLAAEVLSETLGKQWRKLGRKLGLSEVKLESIARKHPSDLEETTVELVRAWRTSRRDQATVQTLVQALVQALRDCELNMSADTVEEKLGL